MAQLTQNKLHGLWGYLQMKGSRLFDVFSSFENTSKRRELKKLV